MSLIDNLLETESLATEGMTNIFPPLQKKFVESCSQVLSDALVEQGILVPQQTLLQLGDAYEKIGKKYIGISDPII